MRPSRAQLVLLSMAASGLLPLQAQTTFYTAIRNNDLAGLRQLVKKSGPNAGDSRHTSPLMQRNDGGWGQTNYRPSDAYATGEALYALHETGSAATDPVYRKGVEYLLQTQQEDGSWHVKTRAASFQPYFESGFPHSHDQWISQAGTGWAVIALSYAAPKPGSVAALQKRRLLTSLTAASSVLRRLIKGGRHGK